MPVTLPLVERDAVISDEISAIHAPIPAGRATRFCASFPILYRMGTSDTPPPLRVDELGERSVALAMDHEAAVEHVREVFSATGFALPTTFSPSERINEELEREVAPYTVIGLGVPSAGDHALEAGDKRVGALFPCSVVVWETDDGTQEVYHLSMMHLAREIGLAPDDERWGALVAQVDKLVDDAFGNLGRDPDGGREAAG